MAEEELAQLLGGRAVLLPYTGPAPAVLANLALKVVANTLDFSQLVAERPDWSNEDPAELLQYVREQVRLRPQYTGFTAEEVLESLVVREVERCLEAGQEAGLTRVAGLAVRLREADVASLECGDQGWQVASPTQAWPLIQVESR